jgi:hypothetical protein
MSTNFQYRFQQHEVIPPGDVWNKIAGRLDEEYDQHDILLSRKLSDLEQAPPALWSSILTELESDLTADKPVLKIPPPEEATDTGHRQPRVIPFRFQRVAAVFALALAVSALYYFLSGKQDEPVVAFTEVPTQTQAGISPSLTPSEPPAEPVAQQLPDTRRSYPQRSVAQNIVHVVNRPATDYDDKNVYQAENTEDITYAAVDNADKRITNERIAVPSRPIRDGAGNIILDEKLVSAPDDNYVTVTGPNGEQTKISKKFLHALSYMNSASGEDDYMGIMLHEGSLWKWLFQEWRQKLLTQPSFIPSAANFLDIMELKEILHENL